MKVVKHSVELSQTSSLVQAEHEAELQKKDIAAVAMLNAQRKSLVAAFGKLYALQSRRHFRGLKRHGITEAGEADREEEVTT